ncbi:TetR family transcriptional regulator [Ornithinimicrobium tianjinense]
MADIAEKAGVSVQMVYFAFGTKSQLFLAVMEAAVQGEDGLTPPEMPEWARAQEEPTARLVIESFVRGLAEIFRRAAPLTVVARVAAGLEADVAAAGLEQDRLRDEGYGGIVRAAAAKGSYREGVDEDAATDVLVSLYSTAFYVELTEHRGWSHERAIDWLATTVPGLLFEP